ncbi:MAG: hypothetical protein NVSMB2_18710 [Chloroflexota bacterium]
MNGSRIASVSAINPARPPWKPSAARLRGGAATACAAPSGGLGTLEACRLEETGAAGVLGN